MTIQEVDLAENLLVDGDLIMYLGLYIYIYIYIIYI